VKKITDLVQKKKKKKRKRKRKKKNWRLPLIIIKKTGVLSNLIFPAVYFP